MMIDTGSKQLSQCISRMLIYMQNRPKCQAVNGERFVDFSNIGNLNWNDYLFSLF